MPDSVSLWALFASAFISSTLFPGGSEAVLAWIARDGAHPTWVLVVVATAGNTLGGMSSWFIGRIVAWRWPARELVKPRQRAALARVRRWGSPVLLLSWLPVVGDPLCVAAGWLRVHWLAALLFIAIGKALRYLVVVVLFA